MLRVKVTLVYIVLVAVLVGLIVAIVQGGVGKLVRQDTESTLQRAALAAEQSVRLDEGALLAKAQFVARGDRLYRSLQGEFVGDADEGKSESGDEVDFEGQRHLDSHEKLTARKYRLDEIVQAAGKERNVERVQLAREPHDPDIFMVLDENGIGVAALGKDLYSWFDMDVAEKFPAVTEVADGGSARIGYWKWSFKPGDEPRLHMVAVAPVRRHEDEQPAGVVVLGRIVNDGYAQNVQRLAAGLTSEDQTKADAEGAPEVAFYQGDKIVGSTVPTDEQQALATALKDEGLFETNPEQVAEVPVDEMPHLAMSRRITSAEQPIGLVVVSNLTEAASPLKALRVNILLVSVAVLLFGAFALVFLVVRFVKPIERLEDGMQEVIAGNKDYVWPGESGHELQSGLAQSLNLMSAYLQGKPMPDDDATGKGWGDLMGGGDPKPQGPGQVQGVDLASLSAPPPKADGEDDEES